VPERVDLFAQQDRPEDQWTDEAMLLGEWILYPNVSFNSFYTGGLRGVLISQVFPGSSVAESTTAQTYIVEHEPDAAERTSAMEMFDFIGSVVGDEDMPASLSQQRGLSSGLLGDVVYGCNEGGVSRFHQWNERIVATHDDDLNDLFHAGL
jgi:carnitine monooxygenase subunit